MDEQMDGLEQKLDTLEREVAIIGSDLGWIKRLLTGGLALLLPMQVINGIDNGTIIDQTSNPPIQRSIKQ